MNTRNFLIPLLIFLIGLGLVLGASIGFWLENSKAENGYQPPENLGHLIACMETARASHQKYVDMPPVMEVGPITINNPGRYYLNRIAPYTTLEEQRKWVEIYDQVIEVLRGIENER